MTEVVSRSGYAVLIGQGELGAGPKHKFGGLPEGIPESRVPQCRLCRHPLHLLLQVDLTDPKLDIGLRNQAFLLVLGCLNCDSYWDPLYYRVNPLGIEVVSQGGAETFGEFPAILPERPLAFAPLERSWSEEDEAKHQLGGAPLWIQDPQEPECCTCGEPMRFVAQVDSDWDAGTQFGDMGILYAFLCPDCGVYATFMQCY